MNTEYQRNKTESMAKNHSISQSNEPFVNAFDETPEKLSLDAVNQPNTRENIAKNHPEKSTVNTCNKSQSTNHLIASTSNKGEKSLSTEN